MAFALLFLGLLPIMFFSDVFPDQTGAGEEGGDPAEADVPTENIGDMLDSIVAADASDGAFDDPLSPVTDDETPFDGGETPDDVLSPVTDDETPVDGDPVDPANVLSPITTPDAEFAIDGDGTMLQQLLSSETDSTAGVGFLGTQITDTADLELSEGADTHAEADDGTTGTGEGALGVWNGTPILVTEGDLGVIDAGAGDDVVTAGDGAAYLFGGAGDDSLAAGEGVSALFGGAGGDTLTGTDTGEIAWLDGGIGNDTLLGGDAGEILDGGAHSAVNAGEQDDDTIFGGGGSDIIRGGYGADTLSGGDGNDVIDHLGRADERIGWERHAFNWHIDNDADTLDGGAGDDTLVMDRADTASGGTGNDTFWVYFDNASGAGAANITDFNVGEDFLRVTLNPETSQGDQIVAVDPSEDGLDSIVSVNGEAVAILRGASGATTADVYVEVVDDVFA